MLDFMFPYWYDEIATQINITEFSGNVFFFGKNAFSALRSLRVPKICVAANGAMRFSMCGSIWSHTFF